MEKVGPQQSFQCPTCRRDVPIPVGGASVLPQNLHLGFEVKVAEYMSMFSSSTKMVGCTFCVKGCTDPAVAFCCSCHTFMCKGGQECHSRAPQLVHHSVVGLDKESAMLLPTLMKPKEHHHCSHPKHTNLELDFYCSTCSSPICQLCALLVHKDHNTAELPTVAEAHREEMRGTLVRAGEVVSTFGGAIEANKKMIQQVETSKQKAELTILQAFKQLVETLEERKKVLLLELETIALSKTTSLTLQMEQFENIQQDIGRYTEVTSHILQTHTDHEVVALRGLLPTELKSTLSKAEKVSLTPNQHGSLSAAVQTDSITKLLSEFGEVVNLHPASCGFTSKAVPMVNIKYHVKVEAKTSKGKRCSCGGQHVKAELRSKSHDRPVVSGDVEDHGDGTYTITLTPITAGPHQLLVTIDGQHIQRSSYDLEVRNHYSTLHNAQQVFPIKSNPLCVAIHENGDIYVGSGDHHIYVFDQGGNLKSTIGSCGSDEGQFIVPAAIAIFGDVMYVADFGNHRIQKLTTGGKFLRTFGEKGSGQGQLVHPRGVAVDSEHRVFVSDRDNNRIVVFSDGCHVLTIDGNGSSTSSFKDPWGVAFDLQGNIHIAAAGSNTIKVFTPEGAHVRTYGDVKGPSGVAVDENGYSYVSERDGNCLTIFDPQGEKVHTVGNLTGPRKAALDPHSGSVYVPSYDSYKVLKYTL